MNPSSPPRRLRPPGPGLVAFSVGLVMLASCAEPDRPPDVEPDPVITEEPIEQPDERDELVAQADVLRSTLEEIQGALTEVSEASTLAEAEPGVDRALANLVVEQDAASSDTDDVAAEVPADEDDGEDDTGDEDANEASADEGTEPTSALLPSQTLDRSESASSPDLLNATMTIAGDVGGDLGRDVADVLSDPIAGDLGAWQQDAAGMVALAQRAATSSTDLARLESAIRELEGEGTRALAWTFAAEAAVAEDDLELARGAAERGLAHVQIMLLAVEDVGGSS